MTTILRRTAAFAVALFPLALCVGAPAPAAPGDPATVPQPAGEVVALTTESGYAAFPNTTRAGVRRWLAYRYGPSHAGNGGGVRVRYADPGKAWSLPATITPTSSTYSYGPAGMDADARGRVYLGVARNQPTGTNTATDHSAWLTWLDPGSSTWAPRVRVPDVVAGFTVASSVLVDGDRVLVTTYGTSGVAVSAYDPVAGIWSLLSSGLYAYDSAGNRRNTAEPTLTRLADGSLLMLLRSDGSPIANTSPVKHYNSYLYATRSTDGRTWAAPWPIVTHATGMPNAETLPTGEVVVMFRGFSTPVGDPAAFPVRLAMLDAEGKPARPTTEQGHDVLAGEQAGRMMYADLIEGIDAESPELVFALESREGSVTYGSSTVYSVPLTFRPVSR